MPLPQSSDSVESQYLKIKEVMPSRPGAFTKQYGIYSKSQGALLAYISWYSSSKAYVLRTEPGTVWGDESLDFISRFLKQLNEKKG